MFLREKPFKALFAQGVSITPRGGIYHATWECLSHHVGNCGPSPKRNFDDLATFLRGAKAVQTNFQTAFPLHSMLSNIMHTVLRFRQYFGWTCVVPFYSSDRELSMRLFSLSRSLLGLGTSSTEYQCESQIASCFCILISISSSPS